MTALKFSTKINAKKEKVWQVLWNDETYRKWTAPFSEGSYAISDWNEGSKIQFLNGNGDGMYGIIAKKILNEQIVFKHLGEVKKGVEELKDWSGALEKYFLTESNGETELVVEIDMEEEYKQYFVDTFPKALEVVKQLSETE